MNKLKLANTLGFSATKNILNPEWGNNDRVHDWRNYISTQLQDIWNELSLDARIVAYYIAKNIADREEWD